MPWVGQSLPRREDPELLTGRGRYSADLVLPGMLHAVFLRSPHPHARIGSIDADAARALPGVRAVLAAAELPDGLAPQPVSHVIWGARETPYYALARDRVRYVGEPVAVVVAESAYLAEDGRDAITVEWEPLPSVGDVEASLRDDAPRLYDEWDDNVAGSSGGELGDVDAALEAADVVVSERFDIARLFGCPLEGRGVLADWDPHADELTLWTSTQIASQTRGYLSELLDLPEHRIHLQVPRMGGGFGSKFHFYPEEAAVAFAARSTGSPVRWIEDRAESFTATVHARAQVVHATIGARRDGTITALKVDIAADLGAALHTVSFGPAWMTSILVTNAYAIPDVRVGLRAVMTNTTPVGSYRGWGAPEANFVIERLVERVARELDADPVEVRRRSFVQPEQMPHHGLAQGMPIDGGRYEELLDRGLEVAGYAGWRARQREMRAAGRHVGIGVSFYLETTGMGPSRSMNYAGLKQGTHDTTRVRVEPGGQVTVFTGICEMGQGFTNGMAQVCADALGIHPDDIRVVTGDSASCPFTGYGTAASRSSSVAAGSAARACAIVREKVELIAAHMLGTTPGELEIALGRISVAGSPGQAVTMADVGRAAYRQAIELPDDMEPGLEATAVYDPQGMEWPYGMNVAVVEVDAETGEVSFLDYAYVHDCGTLLNPKIVEGQITGAIAQGIGMALYEELRYTADGHPLTSSFHDYLLPTATTSPRPRLDHLCNPSPTVPGGMKGVGEAGVIGSPSAVANAIEDALRPFGAHVTRLPVTPARILDLIGERR